MFKPRLAGTAGARHARGLRMAMEFPKPLSAATRLVAVFGQPIRHSASPAMQNAGLATLGLDWRYVACEVPPEQLAIALAGAKVMRFAGVNLTLPHKLLAVPLMDELDESARQWGAVNTVVFEAEDAEGLWRPVGQLREFSGPIRARGYNTDADAFARSIGEDLQWEIRSSRVLLLGAGGAGRTAALRLADEGVSELYLVNRTMAKAEELKREVEERFPAVAAHVGYPDAEVELVLNATSLGLKRGDTLPFDPARFDLRRADVAYDMVYRPSETPFLAAARAAGLRTANGIGMLLYQGAAALALWTGKEAPVVAMRTALRREIYGEAWE